MSIQKVFVAPKDYKSDLEDVLVDDENAVLKLCQTIFASDKGFCATLKVLTHKERLDRLKEYGFTTKKK